MNAAGTHSHKRSDRMLAMLVGMCTRSVHVDSFVHFLVNC